MAETDGRFVTEAVGVFDDVHDLDLAVEDLHEAGFAKDHVSLLASQDAVEKKLGHRYERVEDLEDDPAAPRKAYRTRESLGQAEDRLIGSLTYLPALLAAGTVVASSGVVAAAVTGVAVAGAAIGTVLGHFMDKSHADWLQGQLERGGLLLWVRTETPEAEQKALEILRRHSAHDVHLHKIPEQG